MNFPQPIASHIGPLCDGVIRFPGITLSIIDSSTESAVGWHSHQDPHLTFVIDGNLIEGSRTEVHNCSAGNLLFHSSGEPHYNIQAGGGIKCFHLDFTNEYLEDFAPEISEMEGILQIKNAEIKFLCYKMFRETLVSDDISSGSIQSLSLAILGELLLKKCFPKHFKPSWVNQIEEILRGRFSEKLSLEDLSRELGIHPVHLSRSFSKYFFTTLGEYVRKIRIEKSLSFMPDKNLSLTEIAFNCGFADQSHFLRSFKDIMGVSPSSYRKLLF